jgi:hypothetical protein
VTAIAVYEIETSEADDGTAVSAEYLWNPTSEDAAVNGFIAYHGLHVAGIGAPTVPGRDGVFDRRSIRSDAEPAQRNPERYRQMRDEHGAREHRLVQFSESGSAGPGQAAGAVRTALAASRRFLIIGFGSPLRLTRTTWLGGAFSIGTVTRSGRSELRRSPTGSTAIALPLATSSSLSS